MERLLEFAGNHTILVAALGAIIVYIVFTEVKRLGGSRAINAHEVVRLINDENALLIDVRESSDFKTGHILNARNIPQARLITDISNLVKDKSRPIVLYCKTGSRTNEACRALRAAGYENVSQLKNGYFAWQDANLPVEK